MITRNEISIALKSITDAQSNATRIIAEGMGIGKEYEITDGLEYEDEDDEPHGIFTRIDSDNPVMVDKARRVEHDFEFHAYECNGEPCDFWFKDWQCVLPAYQLLNYLKCDDE